MKIQQEVISPEIALRYLAKRGDNINRLGVFQETKRIEYLAEIMTRGEWESRVPDPILLGAEEKVLNGYHRLSAIALIARRSNRTQ